MTIKRGSVVRHPGATEWGVGKVMEMTELRATIQFSDGIVRKIASSHYPNLLSADPALFVAVADDGAAAKTTPAPKRSKKVRQPAT